LVFINYCWCLDVQLNGNGPAGRAIPGVGPLTAMALVAVYHRGHFRSVDAFIAFMGTDVRVRESGQSRGRRKLTKKGDPELRRLLFNFLCRQFIAMDNNF